MTLWKKSYFFTIIIFQVIIFLGIFIFSLTSFKQQLKNDATLFRQLVSTSDFFVSKIESENGKEMISQFVLSESDSLGFYLEVKKDGKDIIQNIPKNFSLTDDTPQETVALNKEGGQPYLVLKKEEKLKNASYNVIYIKDLSKVYQEQAKRNIFLYLSGLLFTGTVSLIVYWRMKKIYRPIQNISHELRTPLTLIKGYSELLLRVKVNEEKKMEISEQILIESQKLELTVEQLLLMGDLKDGEISKINFYMSSLLKDYEKVYPNLKIKIINEQLIFGNKILIQRLLDNLLTNAYRESDVVSITIDQKKLVITNEDATISKKVLKKLNKGKQLLPNEYSGTGQGIKMCLEIVVLHEGKFEIVSNNNSVTVEVDFNNY